MHFLRDLLKVSNYKNDWITKVVYQWCNTGSGQSWSANGDDFANESDDPPVEIRHRVDVEAELRQDGVHLGERVAVRITFDLKQSFKIEKKMWVVVFGDSNDFYPKNNLVLNYSQTCL